MKIIRILCLGFALASLGGESVRGEDDDPPKRRGGFTGATPKPVAKKSNAAAGAPAVRKKRKLPDEDALAEQKTATGKSATGGSKTFIGESKPAGSTDKPLPKKVTSAEATPAPKKKLKLSEEDAPAGKRRAIPEDPVPTPKPVETAEKIAPPAKIEHAPSATLEPNELAEFPSLPPRTQALIVASLALTKLNLTYAYGSDDPAQGGMDCSGTMAYVLRAQGFKDVPRDSSSQYVWVRKAGPFFAVVSKSAESFEFKDLQPGDLLFWTGTYETGREIPISHVMLYLGTEKKTKKRVMFGASDGRSYAGIQRWGVSVFDFKMPNGTAANGERTKVDFVGYGRIPGLRESVVPEAIAEVPPATPVPVASSAATPKARSATKAAASSSATRKKKRSD